MKIRLVDGSVYSAERAEITNGRLEIDMKDKTAEELQDIFMTQANISNIELLTDMDEKFGDVPGWTVYGGVMLVGDTKTVILTKEKDSLKERLINAEAGVLSVNAMAEAAKALSENTASQVTELQRAICEIYEGMEV